MSSTPGPTAQDPAELVRSIEATRDQLAETVDAIAEKVSPKRVAARTKARVQAGELPVRPELVGGAAAVLVLALLWRRRRATRRRKTGLAALLDR